MNEFYIATLMVVGIAVTAIVSVFVMDKAIRFIVDRRFDNMATTNKENKKMGYCPPPPPPPRNKAPLTNKQLISILRESKKLTLKAAETLDLLGDMNPVEIIELKSKESQDNTMEKTEV